MIASAEVKRAGDLSNARHHIAAQYVASAPELVWNRTEAEALQCIFESIECNGRIEISVYVDDLVRGVLVAVPDSDDHVGYCLSAQWWFVQPEYRGAAGSKLLREFLRQAKNRGFTTAAYTRRVGPAEYLLKYIRLRSNPNGESNQESSQGCAEGHEV